MSDFFQINLTGLSTANPLLLSEEIEAALGVDILLTISTEGGLVTDASVVLRSRQAFNPDQAQIVNQVAENHDPSGLSAAELLHRAKKLRAFSAKGRLVERGADQIRVAGLPDLSDIVADIIEALDLDDFFAP